MKGCDPKLKALERFDTLTYPKHFKAEHSKHPPPYHLLFCGSLKVVPRQHIASRHTSFRGPQAKISSEVHISIYSQQKYTKVYLKACHTEWNSCAQSVALLWGRLKCRKRCRPVNINGKKSQLNVSNQHLCL